MPNVTDARPVIVGNADQYNLIIPAGDLIAAQPLEVFGNSIFAIVLPVTFTPVNITFYNTMDGGDTYAELTETSVSPAFYTLSGTAMASLIAGINPIADYFQIPLDPSVFVGVQALNIYLAGVQATDLTVGFVMAPFLG